MVSMNGKQYENWQAARASMLEPVAPPVVSKPVAPPVVSSLPAAPLIERYRPPTLADVVGQTPVIQFLTALAAAPRSCALLFSGDTGTGKTSAALALAAALGCKGEYGGCIFMPPGEQSAKAIQEATYSLLSIPMLGSGWRVLIVDDFDPTTISAQAVNLWLHRTDPRNIPARSIIIFTTNNAEGMERRLRTRFQHLRFTADADALRSAAVALAGRIWQAETGGAGPADRLESIVNSAIEAGALSFREMVQGLEMALCA